MPLQCSPPLRTLFSSKAPVMLYSCFCVECIKLVIELQVLTFQPCPPPQLLLVCVRQRIRRTSWWRKRRGIWMPSSTAKDGEEHSACQRMKTPTLWSLLTSAKLASAGFSLELMTWRKRAVLCTRTDLLCRPSTCGALVSRMIPTTRKTVWKWWPQGGGMMLTVILQCILFVNLIKRTCKNIHILPFFFPLPFKIQLVYKVKEGMSAPADFCILECIVNNWWRSSQTIAFHFLVWKLVPLKWGAMPLHHTCSVTPKTF